MSKSLKEMEQRHRQERRGFLKDLFDQLREDQQDLFLRLYPNGLDEMPEKKLSWAIGQCERTLKKNIKGRQEK